MTNPTKPTGGAGEMPRNPECVWVARGDHFWRAADPDWGMEHEPYILAARLDEARELLRKWQRWHGFDGSPIEPEDYPSFERFARGLIADTEAFLARWNDAEKSHIEGADAAKENDG